MSIPNPRHLASASLGLLLLVWPARAQPAHEFEQAFLRGDVGFVRDLLQTESGRGLPRPVLTTALWRAIASDQREMVGLLLQSGADPNAALDGGWTPLLVALLHGHADIAVDLLESGAQAAVSAPSGVSAVGLAEQLGDAALLARLRPTAPPAEAMLDAARRGDVAAARAIIAANAPVDARDPLGWTPLMHAAASGHAGFVRFLLDHRADLRAQSLDGATALHAAVISGSLVIARMLLDEGVPVDAIPPGGARPLTLAISLRDAVMAELLVRRGAAPGMVPPEEVPPAQLAVAAGLPELARRLSNSGGNAALMPNRSRVLLMEAIASGDAPAAVTLLRGGMDVNAMLPNGLTAIHWAVVANQPLVVDALLGLRPSLEGSNPLQGADGGNILHSAIRSGGGSAMLSSLRRAAPPTVWRNLASAVDNRGRTPLLLSLMGDGTAATALLQDASLPPEVLRRSDSAGVSPLLAAVLQGHAEAARALLARGVSPEMGAGRPSLRQIAHSRQDAAMLAVLPRPATEAPNRALSRDEIAEAQQLLTSLGFATGGTSGVAGPRTLAALRDFQLAALVPQDSELNLRTLEMLREIRHSLDLLLSRQPRSPRGVVAATVAGAAGRFDRGTAAQRPTSGTPDPAEAAYWYGLAAADGDVRALVQLGVLLARGEGTPADPAGAMLLWRLAAARGNGTAAYNLGAMLEFGIGTRVNRQWARHWYAVAAARGHNDARIAMERVSL